jgi:hypothetical protein
MPRPRNVSVLLQNITRYTCNTRHTRVCALELSLSSDPSSYPSLALPWASEHFIILICFFQKNLLAHHVRFSTKASMYVI